MQVEVVERTKSYVGYVTLGWEKSSSSEHKTKDEVLVDLLLDGR